jgi:hypothetical protein
VGGTGGPQSRRSNRETPGIMGTGRRDGGGLAKRSREREREAEGQGALWCGALRWPAGKGAGDGWCPAQAKILERGLA